jgi:hypothetical protein
VFLLPKVEEARTEIPYGGGGINPTLEAELQIKGEEQPDKRQMNIQEGGR